MGAIDATTWQVLGLLLSVLGLVLSVVLWRRRGPASGLRGVAWALLPAAAGLTGTLKLLWGIGNDIVDWAVRLVFSPVVWSGIVLAGISIALFAVTAAMRARGAGTTPSQSPGRPDEPQQLPGQRSAKPARRSGRTEPAVQDKDMDDIEAILRKHGIN